MIPKAPFERDLSEAEELAAFERLKERLRLLWPAVFPQDDQPYTSVVVPSDSTAVGEAAACSSYLEERLLFLLIRLRNPQARLGVPRGDAGQQLQVVLDHERVDRL